MLLEDGTSFLVRDSTEIQGELSVAPRVKVEAVLSDGVNVATQVNVEKSRGRSRGRGEDGRETEAGAASRVELESSGIVATSTATMLVLEDGTSFVVDEDTDIDGELAAGATVEVKAVRCNCILVAHEIEVG